MKRTQTTHDELARRLRADAAELRRNPPADLRPRVMADLRAARDSGHAHVASAPSTLTFRRLLAAAALIALTATVVAVFSPHLGRGGDNDRGLSAVTANGEEEAGPALVQPLRDAFAFAMDAESPLEAEANRMLADAAHAGRLVLNRLPFRGSTEFKE